MHELITKYIDKTITSKEEEELYRLVQSDDKIKEEFIDAQNIYALSTLYPSDYDEKEGYNRLRKFKKTYQKKNFLSLFKNSMRYTAVVITTVIATYFFLNDTQNLDEIALAYEEFRTPPGQRAILKLYDGTTVWLNAASTLRYPNVFAGKSRNVELDGEAYFDVKHKDNIPFIVSTEKLDIEVLGTKFNVFAYNGQNEFTAYLEEGAIQIYTNSDKSNSLLLYPNEVAELKENMLAKRSVSNKDFLLWKEGIYAFDDLPFQEIINKLELYYDIKIEINNPALAEYKFSGKFRQRDGVVSALRTFQKVYNFSFHKDDDSNHITILK